MRVSPCYWLNPDLCVPYTLKARKNFFLRHAKYVFNRVSLCILCVQLVYNTKPLNQNKRSEFSLFCYRLSAFQPQVSNF